MPHITCMDDVPSPTYTPPLLPPLCPVGEDKVVRVEAVFEPPQSGTATELLLERGTQQEQQVCYNSVAQ